MRQHKPTTHQFLAPPAEVRKTGMETRVGGGRHSSSRCLRAATLGAASFFLFLVPTKAYAQAQVDRFFPPIVSGSSVTRVKAEGKFPTWPATVVCDRDDVHVVCDKESGTLKVTTTDETTPGVAWLRVHDAKGSSKPTPLIISTIPPTTEVEPNNKNAEANPIELPAVVVGKLQKSRDLDAYRISVQAGQRVVASVTAHQILRSPMDAVLQLADLNGNVLQQSEDVRGLDPQIVYSVTEDADLLIRIFSFPEVPTGSVTYAGAASFVYSIDITTGPYVDHAYEVRSTVHAFGHNLPSEPNVKKVAATDISPATCYVEGGLGWSWLSPRASTAKRTIQGETAHKTLPIMAVGHIDQHDQNHLYRFIAKKGVKYRAEVFSKVAGFQLDSHLTIIDRQSGKQLASNDDVKRGGYDAGTDFTATQDGEIEVQLSDMVDGYGSRHAYELLIREAKPAAHPTVDADHFQFAAGKTLEIPIAVNRDRGFNDAITFKVLGLPDGITFQECVSEAKGDTSKTVKLKLTAKDNVTFNGPIEISGTVYQLRPTIELRKIWLTCH